jgi:voltage-gated potassium channel
MLGRILQARKYDLAVTLSVGFLLLIVASCLMYYAENDAQPHLFPSIPAAMWWGVETLTTVGYGDTCPVTGLGKLIASIMAVLGVGMFALPAGILGGGFIEEMQQRRRERLLCPRCGADLAAG